MPKTASVTISPATPTIGAFVTGVDLRAPLEEQTVQELRSAWLQHQVLFFRDQHLTMDEHKRFARSFGDLWINPTVPAPEGHPEVLVVRVRNGSAKAPGQGWHTDMSAAEVPPSGSILRMELAPRSGGDTLFASMYAAWDGLSDHWKRFLEPLDAWHSSAARHGGEFGIDAEHPRALHPIARTHPETGRTALYVNQGFTMEIDGMTAAESRATLEFLFRHSENPAYQARFSWDPGSIAMWDNRCVLHNAMFDYQPEERLGYRLTLTGDRPTR